MSENTEMTSGSNQLYTAKFPKTAITRAVSEYIQELIGIHVSIASSPTLKFVANTKQSATEIVKTGEASEVQISSTQEALNDPVSKKVA